jgi:hypothetical protein
MKGVAGDLWTFVIISRGHEFVNSILNVWAIKISDTFAVL